MFKKHRTAVLAVAVAAALLTSSSVANASPNPRHFTTRNTSALPVVYLGGANEATFLNSGIKKNITTAGMQFFEWDPLMASIKESPKLYDHMVPHAQSTKALTLLMLKGHTLAPQNK